MEIRYTSHAARRLIQRGISKNEVRTALLRGRKADAIGKLRTAVYTYKKRTITVVYDPLDRNKFKVITVY